MKTKKINILKPLILAAFSIFITSQSFSQTISVNGLGNLIVNGDITPDASDSTDFGTALITTSVSDTFRILNTDATNLDLFGISITGTHSSMFVATALASTSIANGDSTDLVITFTPTTSGLKTATVNIFSNDGGNNPYVFDIQGTGFTPQEIDVTGNSVSIANNDLIPVVTDDTYFGATLQAGGSITKTFTINNTGEDTLFITNFALASGGLHFNLGAYSPDTILGLSSDTFDVTFLPAGLGPLTDDITITNNDADEASFIYRVGGYGNTEQEINVTGFGVNIVSNQATAVGNNSQFGDVTTSAGTIVKTFVIENLGEEDLISSNIQILGTNAADFTLSFIPLPDTVNGGGSTIITVTFDPLISGLRVANVTIDNNDVDIAEATYVINIEGNGLADTEIEVTGNGNTIVDGDSSPSVTDNTDFGTVNVGGNNALTFRIHNFGSPALDVFGSSVTGTDPGMFTIAAIATPVAIGDSTDVIVTFTPTSSGAKNAVISFFNSDLTEGTYNFSVTGNGLNNEINVEGNDVTILDGSNIPNLADHTDFGGSSAATIVRTFTIHNINAGPALNLTGIGLSGINVGDFSITSNPGAVGITAGDSVTFDITFTPGAVGVRYAEISIDSDDEDEDPYTFSIQATSLSNKEIDVQGISTISILDEDVTPSNADDTDFGSVAAAGVNTIIKVFTISNTGGADLTINNIIVGGTQAAEFVLTPLGLPGTPIVIPGSGTLDFTITFDPTTDALRQANITITSDDADEGTYNFDIQGTGTAANTYKMEGSTNGNINTDCIGTLYDDSGPTGLYKKNKDYVYTIDPNDVMRVAITFTAFNIEEGDQGPNDCNYDYLQVDYGGTTIKYCNNFPPALNTPLYSDDGSPIVLTWHSDGGLELTGFELQWQGIISATIASNNLTCNNDNSGNLTISNGVGAGNGSSGYQYQLNFGGYGAPNAFTGLAAGNYTLSIKDNNDCKLDSFITLTEPNPVVLSETHTEESCAGIADGFIDLSATSDVGGLNYSFDGSGFTGATNYPGIGTGSLLAIAEDGSGCRDSVTVLFNSGGAGGPGGFASINGNNFFCLADATAHAFTVTGVTNPGAYVWDFDTINPTTLPIISSGQGTGTILVDFSACTDSLYLIVDASNSCGFLTPDTIVVYPSLVAGGFTMAPTTVSSTVTSVSLAGLATPAGGVFSGNSVTPATPDYNPNAAGIGNDTITYTYTDVNSCVHIFRDDIDVITNSGGITGLPANENYCHDIDYTANVLTAIEAFAENNIFSTSDVNARRNVSVGFNIDVSGVGIVFWDGDVNCRIDPSALTDGSHSLNYSYNRQRLALTNPGFPGIPNPFGSGWLIAPVAPSYGLPWQTFSNEVVTQAFYVDSIGGVNIIGDLFACNDQVSNVPYTSQFSHTDGVGTWSMQETPYPTVHTAGIVGTPNTFSLNVDPVAAGSVNSPFLVLYDYASTANGGNSTCTASTSITLTIGAIPTPSFTLDPYYSEQGVPIATTPLPDATGSFSADGVYSIGIVGSDFYPNLADTGSIGIIYTFGDGSCTSADTNYTYVIPNKGVINNLNTAYCKESAAVIITGIPNANQGLVTGTFSIDVAIDPINAIIDNGNNTATFDPSAAGQGTHIVTFSWFDQTILFETNQTVFVDSIGGVIIDGDNFACVDQEGVVAFNALYNHAGGNVTWTAQESPGWAPMIAGFDSITPTAAELTPVTAGSGDYRFIYNYISTANGSGCNTSDTLNFRIDSLPTPSFTLNSFYSEQGVAVNTNPQPDASGFFSGDNEGMSGVLFTPTLSDTGNVMLIYNFADTATSCTNADTNYTYVIPNKGVITNLNATYCKEDLPVTITGVPNANQGLVTGTFSIDVSIDPTAIIDNGNNTATFDPVKAGQGSHIVTFSWLDQTILFETTQTVFVDSIGGVVIDGDNFACVDQSTLVVFNTLYNHSAGNVDWTAQQSPGWTPIVSGFDSITPTASELDPTVLGSTNSPYRIIYDYVSTLNGSGCKAYDTLIFTIAPLPTPSFTLNPYYSELGDTVSTNPQPDASGFFSGDNEGMSGVLFTPTLSDTGNVMLIYNYTDPGTSCTNSDTNYTYVIPNKGLVSNLDLTYCYEDSPVIITGSPNANQGAVIGTFTIDTTAHFATAIVDNADNTATFDPQGAGQGEHIITFTWFDQSIEFTTSQTVFVDSIGGVSIISLDSTCISDTNLVDFIAQYSHANGIGAWTSIANSFDTISSIYAQLRPSLAGTGIHQILYEYTSTDHGSGCQAFDTANFIVHALPVLSFDLDPYYSEQDTARSTNPIPDGTINGDGNFTGAGMVQANFAPQIAGAGGHRITYWYSDPVTGCANTLWDSTTVIPNTGSIVSLTPTYCYDEVPDTIYGNPNGLPNSGGALGFGLNTGTFSISSSSNDTAAIELIGAGDTAIFHPALAGPGIHIITYTFNDQVAFSVSDTILVDSIGPVLIDGLNALHSYCVNEPQIEVTGLTGHNTGSGVFTFNGNSSFAPFTDLAQIDPDFVETAQITYTYTSTLNFSGCTSDTTETIVIHDLPVLSFDLLSNYCTNDSSVLVTGIPSGGSFSGNGTFVIDANYTSQDSVDFTPGNTVGDFNHTLSYSFTDVNQCFNSVDSVFTMHTAPIVQIDDTVLRVGYCELTDPSYPVTGLINGNNINEGYFWGAGITDVDSTDGHAEFITDNVVVGTDYMVYYTYTDANNCYDVDSAQVDVWALPVVTLSGITPSKQYCNNHDNIFNAQQFIGAPPISAGLSGTFVLDTVTTSADQSAFDPNIYINNGQDTIPMSYEYTDNNGCINIAVDTVYVNPRAYPTFNYSGVCIVDPIDFTDATTVTPDGLFSWTWAIGDTTYTTQDATHQFLINGNHSINLEITTVAGCVSDTTVSLEFGAKPTADFYWINECFDPSVAVLFRDTSGFVSLLDTLTFGWEFGDGGVDSIPDVDYQYAAPGDYNVQLSIATNFNCTDTVTKLVSVKPYINTYPYYTDFQTGPDSWTTKTIVETDTSNSWAHSRFILDPNTANLSLSTSHMIDSSDYSSDERTYVSSPCYDFSTLQKPMITFKTWKDFADIGDGVVLESSIDNGQNWDVVGGEQSTDAGINWYNQVVINNGNGPGGNLASGQPLGWSDVKDIDWVEVRHDLDHLIGNSKVIFRIAFNANGAGEDKGFAFDNVWIGERSKYVLVEHFTNTSCIPCLVTSSDLNPFVAKYSKDLIDIQYHTNAILGDQLYSDYQAGPSKREMFYGASQLPQTVTDGKVLNETTTAWVSDSLITRRRALISAKFDIDLVKTVTGNNIAIDATVTAGQNFTTELDDYMAVLEKQITTNDIVVTGGTVLSSETEFNNIVKAMLPDAGGTRISTPWNSGDSQTISEVWNTLSTPFYGLGNDDLEVVVFVQNAVTKEIYQTATTDTSFIEIVIGVDEVKDNQDIEAQFSLNLYPNPTSGDLFLMFNQEINQSAQVHIFNELGSLVEKRDLSNGIGSSFSTEKYSEGIYFMSVIYEGQRFTKRFMVMR